MDEDDIELIIMLIGALLCFIGGTALIYIGAKGNAGLMPAPLDYLPNQLKLFNSSEIATKTEDVHSQDSDDKEKSEIKETNILETQNQAISLRSYLPPSLLPYGYRNKTRNDASDILFIAEEPELQNKTDKSDVEQTSTAHNDLISKISKDAVKFLQESKQKDLQEMQMIQAKRDKEMQEKLQQYEARMKQKEEDEKSAAAAQQKKSSAYSFTRSVKSAPSTGNETVHVDFSGVKVGQKPKKK